MHKTSTSILTIFLVSAFITPGSTTGFLEENKEKRTINLGLNMTAPIQLAGFSVPEGSHRWSNAQEATLTFPVIDGDKRLASMKLSMSALATDNHPQDLFVLLNKEPIHVETYHNNSRITIKVDIPSDLTENCEVTLVMPNLCKPSVIYPANLDGRTLAFALSDAEMKYRKNALNSFEDDNRIVSPKTELKKIDNIEVILQDLLNTKGKKLVALDMDEFLVGRIDATRQRVLLNPNLVSIVQRMKAENADVIVVSQASVDTIESRIDDALIYGGFTERFLDLFDAGLSNQNASSKVEVINRYIADAHINPTTVFFGDDTKEHLDEAMRTATNRSLQLYHFCDPRVLEFTAIEQIQAMEECSTFEQARKIYLSQNKDSNAYLKNDLNHDQKVEQFAQRAQKTYQTLMNLYGLNSQREAIEFLRVQFGFPETDSKHDSEILEKYWVNNG